jgi:hypothetical protein
LVDAPALSIFYLQHSPADNEIIATSSPGAILEISAQSSWLHGTGNNIIEEIQIVLPVLDMAAFKLLSEHAASTILLKQAICLTASTNTFAKLPQS